VCAACSLYGVVSWVQGAQACGQTRRRQSTSETCGKKVDSRVRTLIENGVQLGHRTLIVLVGDRGRDQVRAYGIMFIS